MKEKITAFITKNKTALIVVGILLLIAIIWYMNSDSSKSDGSAESLAKCLKSNGAKFYGSATCGHCNNQKAMFGDSAKDLPYIECTSNQSACRGAGVTAYPTWVFANGKRQTGEVSLDQLRQLAGC